MPSAPEIHSLPGVILILTFLTINTISPCTPRLQESNRGNHDTARRRSGKDVEAIHMLTSFISVPSEVLIKATKLNQLMASLPFSLMQFVIFKKKVPRIWGEDRNEIWRRIQTSGRTISEAPVVFVSKPLAQCEMKLSRNLLRVNAR